MQEKIKTKIYDQLPTYQFKINENGRVFSYKFFDEETLVCNPLPTQEELKTFYSSGFDYNWYYRVRLLKRIQGWHRWRILKKKLKLRPPPKIIYDIGCGHGWFLKNFVDNESLVFGVDYPGEALSHAQKLGINTIPTDDFLKLNSHTCANLITLWHSLEHFIDPSVCLNKIQSVLQDDGILVIAVPNLQSRGVAKRGLHWVWIQQPFVHIWHWTPKSLIKLLESNNFKIVDYFTRDTWDANYLFDGLISRFFGLVFHFANKLARKTDKTFKTVFWSKLLYIIQIYLEQLIRICCYVIYLLKEVLVSRWSDRNLDRSELIIISQKKT